MKGEIVLSQKEIQRVRVMEQVIQGGLSAIDAGSYLGLRYRQVKRLKLLQDCIAITQQFSSQGRVRDVREFESSNINRTYLVTQGKLLPPAEGIHRSDYQIPFLSAGAIGAHIAELNLK